MILKVVLCASILSARPGCVVETTRLVVDVIPAGCAAKAQALIAERGGLHVGVRVVRYGCEPDRRRDAEARR